MQTITYTPVLSTPWVEEPDSSRNFRDNMLSERRELMGEITRILDVLFPKISPQSTTRRVQSDDDVTYLANLQEVINNNTRFSNQQLYAFVLFLRESNDIIDPLPEALKGISYPKEFQRYYFPANIPKSLDQELQESRTILLHNFLNFLILYMAGSALACLLFKT